MILTVWTYFATLNWPLWFAIPTWGYLITVMLTIICWLQHNLLMAHINPTIITSIKPHTFKIMTGPCVCSAHLQNLISHSISTTPQVSSKWLSVMQLRSLGSQIFTPLSQILCHYMPYNSANYVIGGQQRAAANTDINFSKIEIWSSMHIQMKMFHNANKVTPSQLINACPPSDDWPLGCYDNVIVNMDDSKHWPQSGLDGTLRFCLLAWHDGFD